MRQISPGLFYYNIKGADSFMKPRKSQPTKLHADYTTHIGSNIGNICFRHVFCTKETTCFSCKQERKRSPGNKTTLLGEEF